MKKEIVLFDFDGTITRKDTLLEFIKFSKGRFLFYIGVALNLHYLVGYKLKIISNQIAKEKVLDYFFANTPVQKFEDSCKEFSSQVLPSLIRPQALEEIKKFREKNVLVVVVSASPENWISHWANQNQLDLIATKLQVLNGHITGKLLGKNCSGDEKVIRIKERFDFSLFRVIAAFGNSEGDKAMLRLADRGYYKYFH